MKLKRGVRFEICGSEYKFAGVAEGGVCRWEAIDGGGEPLFVDADYLERLVEAGHAHWIDVSARSQSCKATRSNETWVADVLISPSNGLEVQLFVVMDEVTGKILLRSSIHRDWTADRVRSALDRLAYARGKPDNIRYGSGRPDCSQEFDRWARRRDIKVLQQEGPAHGVSMSRLHRAAIIERVAPERLRKFHKTTPWWLRSQPTGPPQIDLAERSRDGK